MIKARYQKMYTEKYKQDMDFVIIGDCYIGPFVDMDVAQKAVRAINKQFAPQLKLTRTEYEKVEFKPDEIWKAFKEHQEDGFLFVQTSNEFECLGDGVFTLAMAISQGDQLYRKVEKEIDWREEVHESLGGTGFHWSTPIAEVINDESDCFLELCRAALRANGEIE